MTETFSSDQDIHLHQQSDAGPLYQICMQIQSQILKMDGRIDAQISKVDGRIDVVGTKIDGINQRLDKLNGSVGRHEGTINEHALLLKELTTRLENAEEERKKTEVVCAELRSHAQEQKGSMKTIRWITGGSLVGTLGVIAVWLSRFIH
jgi:chromosome segregation ATPase